MLIRDVKCGVCRCKGKVDAYDAVFTLPKSELFVFVGKDSSTGCIHLRCPSCKADLGVDPSKVIGVSLVVGYPTSDGSKVPEKNRSYGRLLFAAISAILALFIPTNVV
jgi:hypothetical protein